MSALPFPPQKNMLRTPWEITHRWLDRCLTQMASTGPLYGHEQSLLPIIQGSVFPQLRKASTSYCVERADQAVAIGGLSVGEPHEDMYEMTDLVCNIIPQQMARYLMGVGTPSNLLECIGRGIDMFDCVMPTRNARNAMIFTKEGTINLRNKKWERDFSALDPELESSL